MSDNFEQTVNLKEKMMMRAGKPASAALPTDRIERLYSAEREDLKRITKPPVREKIKLNEKYLKMGVAVLAVLIIAVIAKIMLFPGKTEGPAVEKWYLVKLMNNEIFYGQITDTAADPLIIRNVYYDYDSLKKETAGESANLRLVKRGKETHGGEGTLDVVRGQVVYMEPLKEDSKVLKAILEYEK